MLNTNLQIYLCLPFLDIVSEQQIEHNFPLENLNFNIKYPSYYETKSPYHSDIGFLLMKLLLTCCRRFNETPPPDVGGVSDHHQIRDLGCLLMLLIRKRGSLSLFRIYQLCLQLRMERACCEVQHHSLLHSYHTQLICMQ